MANVTDPLIASLSGSDPQNLMEYITRQKIYDSRYWKEECFGLTLADVLEKAVSLECIGSLPTKFLSLTLKLLQLHPETALVQEAFISSDHDFKYVRALGCLYLRLTARPLDIYETLEPLYRNTSKSKLRVWSANEQQWSILYTDEWIHQLLTESRVVGITLPRLPLRRVLQEAGYLAEGPRPTALKDVLTEHGGLIEYLEYKVKVEKSPAAIRLWELRQGITATATTTTEKTETGTKRQSDDVQDIEDGQVQIPVPVSVPVPIPVRNSIDGDEDRDVVIDRKDKDQSEDRNTEQRPSKKKQRNYDNLFKKTSKDKDKDKKEKKPKQAEATSGQAPLKEGSDEYWNAERAKLGLKPLQK
jgi:pre-mRNA-splicing factor 38A